MSGSGAGFGGPVTSCAGVDWNHGWMNSGPPNGFTMEFVAAIGKVSSFF